MACADVATAKAKAATAINLTIVSSMGKCWGKGEPHHVGDSQLSESPDGSVSEVLGRSEMTLGLRSPASPFASACGAYDEAVKRRPEKLITLRQKARVIKKSR